MASVAADLAAEARYAPNPTHPGEWTCLDCQPQTGARIVNREGHDTWHLAVTDLG